MYFLNLSFFGIEFFGITPCQDGKTLIGELDAFFKTHLGNEEKIHFWPGSRLDRAVSAWDLWVEVRTTNLTTDNLVKYLQLFAHSENGKYIHIIQLIQNNSNENLLSQIAKKTYRYFLQPNYHGENNYARALGRFAEAVELSDWEKWIKLFEGEHNFEGLCIRANKNAKKERNIESARVLTLLDLIDELDENEKIFLKKLKINSLHPEKIIVCEFIAEGFLRGQVRMMVGSLIKMSKGELTEGELRNSLNGLVDKKVGFKVGGYGLVLWKTDFKNHFPQQNLNLYCPQE